jgi:UDP-glucuronate 4-epimerase
VPSIGLRPACVYGPGRDRGTTAAVTEAIIAAARGEAYRIPFATALELHWVADVARAFIDASRSTTTDALVRTVPSEGLVAMRELIAVIDRVVPGAATSITVGDDELPFPGRTAGVPFDVAITPLERGIRATVDLTATAPL